MDPFDNRTLAEEWLSISEQVNNVLESKNQTAEDKLTEIVRGLFNPFKEHNFTK